MRVRWLVALWLGVGLFVWCGVFDVLITRGAKEYLMRQAMHDAGQGPPAEMAVIMRQTAHDAVPMASLFAAPVVLAGFATIWIARRRGGADRQVRSEKSEVRR